MKKQNAKGFGARSAFPVYYVVVPTGAGRNYFELGPFPTQSSAVVYAKGVSLDPLFQGRAISLRQAAA
jgi:hypothetical protein